MESFSHWHHWDHPADGIVKRTASSWSTSRSQPRAIAPCQRMMRYTSRCESSSMPDDDRSRGCSAVRSRSEPDRSDLRNRLLCDGGRLAAEPAAPALRDLLSTSISTDSSDATRRRGLSRSGPRRCTRRCRMIGFCHLRMDSKSERKVQVAGTSVFTSSSIRSNDEASSD